MATVKPTAPGSTIRAVELETGISAMTLRDWEKRFDWPAPKRRPGSNRRLYAMADIVRLKLVKGAMARGYRIGDLVTKSNSALERIVGVAHVPSIDALIRLLAEDDVEQLDAHLRSAATGLDPRRFVVDVVTPLLVAIGDAWKAGRLSVRHEHLASEHIVTALRRVYATLTPGGKHPIVILTTLPNEAYSLPLLIVTTYLASRGAKTHLLGNNTPVHEIAEAARALGADAVGLSVSRKGASSATRERISDLRGLLPRGVGLWVGGRGAPMLELPERSVQVMTTWEQIDDAVAAKRARSAIA